MKNVVLWHVTPYGSYKNRRFGGIIATINRVTRIGDLGTLAVTSNRSTRRHPDSGDDVFLRNVVSYKSDRAQRFRRRHSS
jgi:hypothetical protein